MIEMVVTLAIISIVSVGLMSLLWVNSWWIFKLSNKTDNIIAAQQFLDRLAAEIRAANSFELVDVPAANAVQTLTISVPVFDSNRIGNAQFFGMPTGQIDKLTYRVSPDTTNLGQYVITRSVSIGTPGGPTYHPEDGRSSISETPILTGVVGPLDLAGANPKIFEQTRIGNPSSGYSTTYGIAANVEMKRSTSGGASDPLAFRTEVFLRNNGL